MTLQELIKQAYEKDCSITLEQKEKLEEEFYSLQDDSIFLNALKCAGVDNWDGYDCALEMIREDE